MARWLTRGRQAFVVMAMMAAVAGCVSMPDSGPVGTYGPNQENTAPALQYVGPFVTGPGPDWTPSEIVQGFLDRNKFVILCTNALLMTKKIDQYKPHANFTWSIHLDGDRQMHTWNGHQ